MAALAAAALLGVTGTAAAWQATPVVLSTSHGVGIYGDSTSAAGKVANDIFPGWNNKVWAMCWTVGQSIGNYGDVWYEITEADYNGPGYPSAAYFNTGAAWTFAPYVDGAAAFHNGLAQCPQSIPN